jgi:LPXTG-motif cell wall-anchored protein
MKKLVYLGMLIALIVAGLSMSSLAGAQETGAPLPEPVNVGETTPVEQGPGAPLPEPVNVGETTPVEQQPAPDSDQYDEDDKISIPEPQPSTPVEGPPSGGDEVTELPDTGGVSGLMLLGGALLLGGGLVVRRIVR